eukprot:TRINITY_DN451_c1_g2_i2.p1 TRINITY_DN451_c1_g2~~TRINITY_DN451_c1_g2_i2.p1  ORF type:complete len:1716 (+),score=603.02 TRINITY_DN451_c1_g2_i2:129-5276(+)
MSRQIISSIPSNSKGKKEEDRRTLTEFGSPLPQPSINSKSSFFSRLFNLDSKHNRDKSPILTSNPPHSYVTSPPSQTRAFRPYDSNSARQSLDGFLPSSTLPHDSPSPVLFINGQDDHSRSSSKSSTRSNSFDQSVRSFNGIAASEGDREKEIDGEISVEGGVSLEGNKELDSKLKNLNEESKRVSFIGRDSSLSASSPNLHKEEPMNHSAPTSPSLSHSSSANTPTKSKARSKFQTPTILEKFKAKSITLSSIPLFGNPAEDEDKGDNTMDSSMEEEGESDDPTLHHMRQKLKRMPSYVAKDFWMPDNQVKLCYDCQAPFSALRRRHHCRLCGQIFCHKCSQNYLKMGENLMRVCNSCFRSNSRFESTVFSTTSPVNAPITSTISQDSDYSRSDSKSESNSAENSEGFLSKNFQSPPISASLLDYTKDIENERKNSNLSTSLPKDYPMSIDELMNNRELEEEEILKPLSLKSLESPIIQRRNFSKAMSFRQDSFSESMMQEKLKEENSTPSIPTPAIVPQMNVAEEHLSHIVDQLLKQENLDVKWKETIMQFAQRACREVHPRIRYGDKMDIRNYVKIKLIPEGSLEECRYVNGVVFTKNLAHKCMKRDISKPKILLLNCAIEFQRANRLLQLDDVLLQERSFLKLLVAQIAALEPDLLIIGKTVSRLAQEFLIEEGIAFTLNVKQNVIERIARATSADILISLSDHLLSAPSFASVESFRVETFKGSFGVKPCLFLEGSPKDLGCTILLRGDSKENLSLVKRVLQFAIYAAHNLYLEISVLIDQYCSIPKEPLKPENILSCSISIDFDKKKNENKLMKASKQETKMEKPKESIVKSEKKNKLMVITAEHQFEKIREGNENGGRSPKPNVVIEDVKLGNNIQDHQKLLYLHSLCSKTNGQCMQHDPFVVDYYGESDITVGQFLETFCFNSNYKCKSPTCGKGVTEHIRSFVHGDGRINLMVSKAEFQLKININIESERIITWTFCRICGKMNAARELSEEFWNYSFGKFLELSFYCDLPNKISPCHHSLHRDHIRYFYWKDLVLEIEYEKVHPMDVFTPTEDSLPPTFIKKANNDVVPEIDLESIDINIGIESTTALIKHVYESILLKLNQIAADFNTNMDQNHLDSSVKLWMGEKEKYGEMMSAFEFQHSTDGSLSFLHRIKKDLYKDLLGWGNTLIDLYNNLAKDRSRKKSSVVLGTKLSNHSRRTSDLDIATNSSSSRNSSPLPQRDSNSPPKSLVMDGFNSEENNSFIGSSTELPVPNLIRESFSSVNTPSLGEGKAKGPMLVKHRMISNLEEEIQKLNQMPSHEEIGIEEVKSLSIEDLVLRLCKYITSPFLIANQLCPSTCPAFLPLPANNVHCLVFENEPSSLIAYNLCSIDYKKKLDTLTADKLLFGEDSRNSKIEEIESSNPEELASKRSLLNKSNVDIDIKWQKAFSNTTFTCITHYPKQFQALRSFCCGEDQFIQSLSRCQAWDARGGKQKSHWSKTLDGRFVVKEISAIEKTSFIGNATKYFSYLYSTLFDQVPTILAKILGLYTIILDKNGKKTELNLVVIDNLFFNHTPTQVYDLKGSRRSRYVQSPGPNEVLLDENLLEVMFTNPIWVGEKSTATLRAAIWNDSLFLSQLDVMDYSLLCGIDMEKKQFVVGIIDYIRQYDLGKQIETLVKRSGLMGGGRAIPTVISPMEYKSRFRDAMNVYFVVVPTKRTNFRLKKTKP